MKHITSAKVVSRRSVPMAPTLNQVLPIVPHAQLEVHVSLVMCFPVLMASTRILGPLFAPVVHEVSIVLVVCHLHALAVTGLMRGPPIALSYRLAPQVVSVSMERETHVLIQRILTKHSTSGVMQAQRFVSLCVHQPRRVIMGQWFIVPMERSPAPTHIHVLTLHIVQLGLTVKEELYGRFVVLVENAPFNLKSTVYSVLDPFTAPLKGRQNVFIVQLVTSVKTMETMVVSYTFASTGHIPRKERVYVYLVRKGTHVRSVLKQNVPLVGTRRMPLPRVCHVHLDTRVLTVLEVFAPLGDMQTQTNHRKKARDEMGSNLIMI